MTPLHKTDPSSSKLSENVSFMPTVEVMIALEIIDIVSKRFFSCLVTPTS
jgi:hypothetical protein